MARIKPAYEVEEAKLEGLSPMERLAEQQMAILAHRPELGQALLALVKAMQETGTLSPRLKEMLRLRVAFHNQCRSCMAVRYDPASLGEEAVCSLERPEEADDVTPGERVALRYADLHATNHLAIDDELFAELREHFSEGEILEIAIHCGEYVGYGRMTAAWLMTEDLPERFQGPVQGATYTPWGPEALMPSARNQYMEVEALSESSP